MKNEQLHKIKVFQNAFIVYWKEQDIFNQVKGKNIDIYIEDNEMKILTVDGNAESIYYTKDDADGYIGGNQSTSGNIIMVFDEGELQTITLINAPEATFTPMKKITTTSYQLDGFKWEWKLKPKTKYDVIRNVQHYENFVSKHKMLYTIKEK
jgi:hypothetical protein